MVYYSLHGNTKRVAEALARAGAPRAVSLEALTAADLAGTDLVVMGSPIHYQDLPKAVRPVLAGLPRTALAGNGWRPSTRRWRCGGRCC